MRRRLRQQKRMREALLLDLGALVYELHRHSRREPELLQAKAAELTAVDQEVRALADALEADESMLTLVAAGIAGSCENCGSLLSTDARYCGACGSPAVPAIGATTARESGPTLTEPLPDPELYERYAPVEEAEAAAEEPYEEPLSDDLLPAEDEPLADDEALEEYEPLSEEEDPAEQALVEDEPPGDQEPLEEAEALEEVAAEGEPSEEDEPLEEEEEPLAPWLADPEERPDA